MKVKRWWMVVGGAAVLVLVLLATISARRGDGAQYLTAAVQRGEIRDAVDATGTVNAVVTVQVGSQVSGTISQLKADFNSRVHKGDVIALIDPTLLQGTLLQAKADLENARASVAVAESDVTKADAAIEQTKSDYDRAAELEKTHAETEQVLAAARAAYQTAQASLTAARAGVVQAGAQVKQKEAAVEVAQTNLDHTVIRSPVDGIVVARNVDVGQTVAASLQAPTIFTIAQDLTQMQVYANVDESDVGRIRLHQPVTFKVDAFPKETFQGVVSQLRMNPTTIQNVVTYNAIVDFRNPDLKLFPGMTAYVTIPVATAENVVKLPNGALRFRPPLSPEELRDLLGRQGIDPAALEAASAAGDDGAAGAGGRAARGGGKRPRNETVVWKLAPDHTLLPVAVALGITDHAYTEVVSVVRGELRPGDELVTSAIVKKSAAPGAVPR